MISEASLLCHPASISVCKTFDIFDSKSRYLPIRHCLPQMKGNMHTAEINEALEETIHSNVQHFQQVWQGNMKETLHA